MLYKFLDIFFLCFHASFILFNIFGWMFRVTRKWNLLALSLTSFSWFVLGIWYGWGYCVFTDWHWEVRQHLGYDDKSNSYIHFLLLELSGINFSSQLVDTATVILFFTSFALSIGLNIKDYRKKKQLQVF